MITKNFVYVNIERYLRFVISFFVNILIIRTFSVSDYGYLSTAINLYSIFGALCLAGGDQYIQKCIGPLAKHVDKINELQKFILIRLLLSTLLYIFSMVAVILDDSIINKSVYFIYGTYLIFQSFDIYEVLYRDASNFKFISFIRLTSGVICNVLKVACCVLSVTIEMLAAIYVAEYVVVSVIYIYFSSIQLKFMKLIKTVDGEFFRKAFWYGVLSGATLYLYKIEFLFLRFFYTDQQIGEYSAALKFDEFFLFLYGSFFIVNIKKINRIGNLWSLASSSIVLIAISIVAEFLILQNISLVLGEKYEHLEMYSFSMPFKLCLLLPYYYITNLLIHKNQAFTYAALVISVLTINSILLLVLGGELPIVKLPLLLPISMLCGLVMTFSIKKFIDYMKKTNFIN